MTDPIRVEVVRRGVELACQEMGEALARSAFSPNIKERRDFSCAAFDAAGRMVAHAAHIPVHLGAMPASMDAALADRPADAWRRGDVYALNDPYRGGTHLPDVTLVLPVFDQAERVGFVATRAHHADVGGREPGSIAPGRGDAVAEGLTIPGVLFWDAGVVNTSALRMFYANSRTPEEREGDLLAQRAALLRGEERLVALRQRHGPERFQDDLAALLEYGARRMEHALAALPDGVASAARDVIDSDGVTDHEVPIAAVVTRTGDRVVVDLTASGDEVEGNLNAPRPVTVSSVLYALITVLDPAVPPNQGALDRVDVRTRPGSVLDPRWPAQTSGGNVETSQRVVDVVLQALAGLVPERVPASSQGTMNNLMVGMRDDAGRSFSYYETMGGGEGGHPFRAGANAVHTHMTNTQNTPVEALERAYPLRVYATRVRTGSGGIGAHPGGAGIERILGPTEGIATVSLLGERRRQGPPGVDGGGAGAAGEDHVWRAEEWEPVPPKGTFVLRPGEKVRIRSPGGGGHGAART